MNEISFLSQSSSLTLVVSVCAIFTIVGVMYSKKHQGIQNYLTANRKINFLPLSTSLTASALGAWILFGPASAATWGGIGAVIGYALGTAFPMLALIVLGKKIRNKAPSGTSLIEFLKKKYGKNLFKLILFMTIFYMFIFLCAEVTAIALLINYISATPLWITSLTVLSTTLIYTLYGGLRVSIFTDIIQTIIILVLFLILLNYIISFQENSFSIEIIRNNRPQLISNKYIPNYTSGITFFIAVAATNLFHQGNWQRVYAAKNVEVLKKSLLMSFVVIIPIIFFMGFSGLVAVSINPNINPDLAFFSLLLRDQTELLSIFIIVLGLTLTISTVDTLINAISSSVIIDFKAVFSFVNKKNYLKISKYFIIFISSIAFVISSKGFSILYLFLLADLFCCAAVISVFYGFFSKKINEKNINLSIIIGLILGFLLFPSPNFSKSILVGVLFPEEFFPNLISNYLLFWSFLVATLAPIFVWKVR
tara:strand:+ start:171 stop:1607 length:1437 start_codon:yes stop_codon:yes gene_type:complete